MTASPGRRRLWKCQTVIHTQKTLLLETFLSQRCLCWQSSHWIPSIFILLLLKKSSHFHSIKKCKNDILCIIILPLNQKLPSKREKTGCVSLFKYNFFFMKKIKKVLVHHWFCQLSHLKRLKCSSKIHFNYERLNLKKNSGNHLLWFLLSNL